MKILRLELFGFKSFKDKTIVAFNQPITAIVGSNGCGKSNVVDALYWVMGDMSPKHLRGHSMQDVIFSGSKDHLPMDMAEVTLVLERDPEKDPELPPQFQSSREVQVTRRYYRNGESEYYLNKTICRLRDIQEFFMDTGVGAKAYSIIEQGAIGRMVAQKPEERRLVIEEVAGIMKYKARKAETVRKIEASKLNLDRIDDIIKDLQRQLTSLKRQADKAEKYKKYSDELKSLEVRVASQEWVRRSESKQEAAAAALELRRLCEALQEKLNSERAQLEERETTLLELEGLWLEKQKQSRQAELAVKDGESQLTSLHTRHESAAQRQQSDQQSLEELETRSLELEQELQAMLERIEVLSNQARELSAKSDTAIQDIQLSREHSSKLRSEVEGCRTELHREELEQTRLTQEIQGLQRQHSQLQGRQDSFKVQLENIESKLELHTAERQSTLDSLEGAFSARSDLETEKNQVNETLLRLETQKTQRQNARDEIKAELTALKIRREHFVALDRDLDGVEAAAKSLALHLRSEGREQSLLADFMHVPPVLERSVEAVLGRHLQRIQAADFAEVERLREWLSGQGNAEARAGRMPLWLSSLSERAGRQTNSLQLDAIFLSSTQAIPSAPLSPPSHEMPGPDGLVSFVAATPTTAPEKTISKLRTVKHFLLEHPDVVGPLDQLIKNELADNERAPWLNLLGNCWVVRDRACFAELATTLADVPLNFVSLEGDVLTAEGYVDLAPVDTAAREQNAGLVQRKREIEELQRKESHVEVEFQNAQAQFDACLAETAQAKEHFRELTARLAALDPAVEKHSLFLRQVEATLARLSEKKDILSNDLTEAIREQSEISVKLQHAAEGLASAEARKGQSNEKLKAVETSLQAALALQSHKEQIHQHLTAESKKLDKEIADAQSQKAALDQEKILSAARREQLQLEVENLSQNLLELDGQIAEAKANIAALQESLQELQKAEATSAANVEQHKGELRDAQKQVEALAQEFQTVSGRIKDMEQSVAVNEVEIRNISERLKDTYQIQLEALEPAQLQELLAPGDLEELADPESAKQRVQQLRTKIENLGKINMVAAEEFDTLSRQHEYLFVQRQDLFDSMSQLQAAIDRINRESKERFASAFNAVNTAFQTTFPVLFGGGNAELRLSNPDDMLETGVEIVAQPPGKKLQSVTLLSGGEKALTAVSLIFGIFSIKPSPFCVLDEVDAPLDDANVGRFNTQVRKMAETSQIIIITHHKHSMESCDALFGVTMEQPGVSKLASARLSELRE